MTTFSPMIRRSALICGVALLTTYVQAQEDFRNRPWMEEDIQGVAGPTIKITETGVLRTPLPQYVYFDAKAKAGEPGTLISFQLTDAKGANLTWTQPATTLQDCWNTTTAVIGAPPVGNIAQLFANAGGGADTRWAQATYGTVLANPGSNANAWLKLMPSDLPPLATVPGTFAPVYALLVSAGKDRPGSWVGKGTFDNATGKLDLALPTGLATNTGALRYKVERDVGPWPGILRAWITTLHVEHGAELDAQRKAIAVLRAKAEDARRNLLDPSTDCDAKWTAWAAFRTDIQKQITLHNQLVARWQIQWLWYTCGEMHLDPIGGVRPLPDTTGLAEHKERWKLLDEQIECCSGERTPYQLRYLMDERDDHRAEHQRITALLKAYEAKTVTTGNPAFVRTRNADLYDGLLYISDDDKARMMRHSDAARSYRSMTTNMRGEYYDFEERHFIVHNYKGDPDALSLEQVGSKAEHVPSITEETAPVLTGLGGLIGGVRGLVPAVAPFFANLSGRAAVPAAASAKCELINDEATKDLAVLLTCMDNLDLIAGVLALRTPVPVPSAYSIEVDPKGEVRGDQHVSYSLKRAGDTGDAKTVATGKFDLWKKKSYQLFGGLAVNWFDMERTTLVESNGVVDVKRENERIGFLVGIKVYPWGSEIDDNRFLLHERRVGFMFGLGLPTPLADLYAGVGYDVYPGVNVGVLAHWYRNEAGTIFNNKVTERRYVYSWPPLPAATLTLDGTFFTNIIKAIAL